MSNLVETSNFDANVYQIAISDQVIGGPGGVSNTQAQQLANRTRYLKDRLDNMIAAEVNVQGSTSYVGLTAVLITGVEYTTPNDGITRRYVVSFKAQWSNTSGANALAILQLKNITTGTVEDVAVGEAASDTQGTLCMHRVLTIGPNVHFGIYASAGTNSVDVSNKILIFAEV